MAVLDLPIPNAIEDRTLRNAMIYANDNAAPGDEIVVRHDIDNIVDDEPSSPTYGRRILWVAKGIKWRSENPIIPERNTLKRQPRVTVPPGHFDKMPICEPRATQNLQTGVWYRGEFQGFEIAHGNVNVEDKTWTQDYDGHGVFVDASRPYATLNAVTLCTIRNTWGDAVQGPGTTLACYLTDTGRHGCYLNARGARMLYTTSKCHRAYASESNAYVLNGLDISHSTFLVGTAVVNGRKIEYREGYIDSSIAPGNGFDFGLRFTHNTGNGLWAYAGTWNFNGFIAHDVEIGWNDFPTVPDHVKQGYETPAVDLRNVVGGSVHHNGTKERPMPCKGVFALLNQRCKYVNVFGNEGGALMTKQTATVTT